MSDVARLLEPIREIHARIRDAVVAACVSRSMEALSAVASEEMDDTIFAIDRVGEQALVESFAELAREEPVHLVAEGLPGGALTLPRGAREDECRWRVLMDPIDGTRGLMYQKRSAWILTGVAPNRGTGTRLSDITLAVQTEVPLVKQRLADQLWAIRGQGAEARRMDPATGSARPLVLRPSGADSLRQGFATVVRFFPGARAELGAVDDELMLELLGAPAPGRASCFEDQYASTGGELYELMAGHDRFIADLRPLVRDALGAGPLCCHPYDLCTALIAQELGVVITDAEGNPVDAPFDTTTDVAWVGYANRRLRDRVAPVLVTVLRRRGLLGCDDARATIR